MTQTQPQHQHQHRNMHQHRVNQFVDDDDSTQVRDEVQSRIQDPETHEEETVTEEETNVASS